MSGDDYRDYMPRSADQYKTSVPFNPLSDGKLMELKPRIHLAETVAERELKNRISKLKELLGFNAPPSIIVPQCYSIARLAHGGFLRTCLYAAWELIEHCWNRATWLLTRGWWLIRYPGKSAASILDERYKRICAENDAELLKYGYTPEDQEEL